MATFVKIGGQTIPATISGKVKDIDWDNRSSKNIYMEADFATVDELFVDDAEWSILEEYTDENGEIISNEYDNSDYCIAGPITCYRDGMIAVKMGKETTLEKLFQMLYGEDEEE